MHDCRSPRRGPTLGSTSPNRLRCSRMRSRYSKCCPRSSSWRPSALRGTPLGSEATSRWTPGRYGVRRRGCATLVWRLLLRAAADRPAAPPDRVRSRVPRSWRTSRRRPRRRRSGRSAAHSCDAVSVVVSAHQTLDATRDGGRPIAGSRSRCASRSGGSRTPARSGRRSPRAGLTRLRRSTPSPFSALAERYA